MVPTHISQILKNTRRFSPGARLIDRLRELWPRVVGEIMSEYFKVNSEVRAFRRGSLIVAVNGASIAQEIQFYHHRLIDSLNKNLGKEKVKRIVLKV